MDDQLRAERDALATLGLLARTHLLFDQPIPLAAGTAPTHFAGLNVHCCIVDNTDGEVVAIDRNRIHSDESPIQHAEQTTLRAAIERIHLKRPRAAGRTVEDYYRSSIFMAKGTQPGDFLRLGCTLYNAFDPCPMCASTLLIASMKRIAFIIPDEKFKDFYESTKKAFFSNRESLHGRVDLGGAKSPLIAATQQLLTDLDKRVGELLAKHTDLINVLDYSADLLARAAKLLRDAMVSDLVTRDEDYARNARTLTDLKRACNFPDRS